VSDPERLRRADHPSLERSADLRDVVALLAALELDDEQADTRARMLAFAADHTDALARTCPPGTSRDPRSSWTPPSSGHW